MQKILGLEDTALIDMGDFAGGLLKYLRKNPVEKLTLAGGPGKIAKLAISFFSAVISKNFSPSSEANHSVSLFT